MKLIKAEDAVGQMLCHDMTQIIKGEYKDARFRKGHIVTEEDIRRLYGRSFGIVSSPVKIPASETGNQSG